MADCVLPVLCIVLALGSLSAGNLILDVKPATIYPNLTSDLTVTCSFIYDNQPNISSIISLVISKADSQNNQTGPYSEILSINVFGNQVIQKGNTAAIATGNIDSNTLDAFLSLSWSSPSQAESGFYRCDANVLDDFGHPVDISTSTKVTSSKPDLDALTGIVGTLQADLAQANKELDKQASDLQEAMFKKSQTYNGHLYLFSEVFVMRTDLAEYLCNISQGYLLEIDDESEYQFIINFLDSTNYTIYIMLGPEKDEQSGQWVFRHSGRPATYFKWLYDEPNDGGNCLIMYYSGSAWGMDDVPCGGFTSSFVCEVPDS